MVKGYNTARRHITQMYEIVQLLRLTGARIELVDKNVYRVRLAGSGSWKKQTYTTPEMKAMFGPGTEAYRILLRHPRASTIERAKSRDLA